MKDKKEKDCPGQSEEEQVHQVTGLPESGWGRKLRTVENNLRCSSQPASRCTTSLLGQLGAFCRASWKSSAPLSPLRQHGAWGDAPGVASPHRPASARRARQRRPADPLPSASHSRPSSRRAALPGEINLFRSLSARLPSPRLSPGRSDACLPFRHRDTFFGGDPGPSRPPSRQTPGPTSEVDVSALTLIPFSSSLPPSPLLPQRSSPPSQGQSRGGCGETGGRGPALSVPPPGPGWAAARPGLHRAPGGPTAGPNSSAIGGKPGAGDSPASGTHAGRLGTPWGAGEGGGCEGGRGTLVPAR